MHTSTHKNRAPVSWGDMFCDTNRSHMFTPKRCVSKLLLAFLIVPSVPIAWGSAYDAHPKLVVVLVVDQLRADCPRSLSR